MDTLKPAKEQAKILFNEFVVILIQSTNKHINYKHSALKCAIKCVESNVDSYKSCLVDKNLSHPMMNYWNEVKTKLLKL